MTDQLRIFSPAPELQPRRPRQPVAPAIAAHDRPITDDTDAAALDRAMIVILAAPPAIGETIEAAHRRKERELAALLAGLPAARARELYRRLAVATPDDPVVAALHRLIAPRRARLLALLADAPRREAIARGRR